MPSITLTRKDVEQMVMFCKDNNLNKYFIAKDKGAYLGASTGANNCLFYFKKCNPTVDTNWYDNCHDMFGGDDFGEHFPVDQIAAAIANDKHLKGITWKVNKKSIKINGVY